LAAREVPYRNLEFKAAGERVVCIMGMMTKDHSFNLLYFDNHLFLPYLLLFHLDCLLCCCSRSFAIGVDLENYLPLLLDLASFLPYKLTVVALAKYWHLIILSSMHS
jgi:hypothetical protein